MPRLSHVPERPSRPTLFYDSECSFCRNWIRRFRLQTGDAVQYIPFQKTEELERYGVARSEAETSIQYVDPSGAQADGARAVFWALSAAPHFSFFGPLSRSRSFLLFAQPLYQLISHHRKGAAWVDWFLLGKGPTRGMRLGLLVALAQVLRAQHRGKAAFTHLRPRKARC